MTGELEIRSFKTMDPELLCCIVRIAITHGDKRYVSPAIKETTPRHERERILFNWFETEVLPNLKNASHEALNKKINRLFRL